MFVVETRRNSSPQISVVTPSSHGNNAPPENGTLTFRTDEDTGGHDSEDICHRSAPITEASPLDRQSLLLRAVASSKRSQNSRPPHTGSNTTTNNRFDNFITTPRCHLRNAYCDHMIAAQSQRPIGVTAAESVVMIGRIGATSPRGGDSANNSSTKTASSASEVVEPSCPPDCMSPLVCKRLLSLSEDMNLLVRNITKEAKTLVHAETCSLFLLDKEHSELVAEVFEKNGTSDEYLTEIRMPLSKGIVGHVASTGQMMNVKDVYNHPYFYPKVDERTGFVTRNILCFPIKDSSGNLVGVAELCNKIGRQAFTRHDEQIATTFAVYCAISISHCLLYRKLQEAHRRSHMAAELLVQGSTLSIAPEDILRFTVRDIPASTSFHPDFTQFFFVPRSIGTGDTYVEASLSMFKELGFIERFRLRRRTLARFLLMVQKGYRDVPYHNWSHAFAVGHFCYLLVRTAAVRSALSELERLSLFVACLCHDIDHRGTTNAFQLQSKTPLAQLYSSEGSVLERHHFAQTVSILSMEECNIFDQLTRQQYQTVLDNIREIILATDIAAHLRKVDRIKKMVEDGYDRTSSDHHYLLMCLLMTAADLSDQSKDFKNSKAIAENIYKEFFSQGDLEKQMGNRPLEMMDRDRACVPKIQLEFMDTVALPVFDYVSRILPDVKGTYNAILLNRRCWQMLDQILKEEGLPRGGLDYLRNVDLEEKVLKRIAECDQQQR